MRFEFNVNAEVERTEGRFASRDEIAGQHVDWRMVYWALRSHGETEMAEKILAGYLIEEDDADHGDDFAQKWGVRL